MEAKQLREPYCDLEAAAKDAILSRELELAWQQTSPGYARGKRRGV